MFLLLKSDLYKLLRLKSSALLILIVSLETVLNALLTPGKELFYSKNNDFAVSLISMGTPIFLIIVISVFFCDELNKGTIKTVLFQGYTKQAALLSKFLSIMIFVLLYFLLSLIVIYAAAIVTGNIEGFSTVSALKNISAFLKAIPQYMLLALFIMILSFAIKRFEVIIIICIVVYFELTTIVFDASHTSAGDVLSRAILIYSPFGHLGLLVGNKYPELTLRWLMQSLIYSTVLFMVCMYKFIKVQFTS